MREVTRDQFYSSFGDRNVHPYIVSDKYPYTTEWKDPRGKVYGKIIPEDGVFPPGTYPFYTEHYFLAEDVKIVTEATTPLVQHEDYKPLDLEEI